MRIKSVPLKMKDVKKKIALTKRINILQRLIRQARTPEKIAELGRQIWTR